MHFILSVSYLAGINPHPTKVLGPRLGFRVKGDSTKAKSSCFRERWEMSEKRKKKEKKKRRKKKIGHS